tara:strand:+ start:662 stop:1588 length:927 start_codon:yes stop_codon:yes gene_type:complete
MTDQVEDQVQDFDEDIEEAHDPKNAEEQSVAATKKAGEAGPKAKARKGDKKNSEKAEKAKMENKDFSDDLSALDALVESEATLSEEFRDKAGVIFEAAVKVKLAEEIDRLEESYASELAEEITAVKTDLVEKVDSYLNYVVENWMEENQVAIQAGLRTEIAEDFMGGLKNLFVESYIEIPDEKVDLVDDLAMQVEELEEKLNRTTEQAIAVNEELTALRRDAIIREHAVGLAETQFDKLKKLAENVAFESEEAFASKVADLKEAYFSKTEVAADITEETDTSDDGAVSISEGTSMDAYINAIRKSNKA